MKSLGNGKLTGSFDAECIATREILTRVGDKWSILVLVSLGEGPVRFNDLKRTIGGISQRMLTTTVRALQRDGFVKRTVHPTNPPQVDYSLTPLGETLQSPILALATWAQDHRAQVYEARKIFDRESEGVTP